MFPYKDENPTELTPLITVGIIVLNVLAWLFVQGAGAAEPLARSVCQLGLIPAEVLRSAPPGTSVPLDPDDPRSGRWSGQKLECGIHIQPAVK